MHLATHQMTNMPGLVQIMQLIILQDFRWSSELICWKDLLLLLEGEPVKLPSLKNQFATDVCIKIDITIFPTSKAKIAFVGKHNMKDNQKFYFKFL